MAKVSLRIYTREIESLIDQNQFDEAVAHCKHILRTFPKHLETYRLLGKIYLETKRYADAAEIFQRVLLAVPDDFVSHVGMSIIHDDGGRPDEAIWHMERAFERQPSNAAVQGELQRLYGRRDGVEPPKIRMTRGALAHMYVQGELYPQAIGEIRGVLAEDPNRMDMQALLALAYFRNGQKVESSEFCATLLKKYAYCLDANRILVEILPGTGRAEDTQVYRHRVNELDPYSAFVSGSIFQSESVPDAAVSLERLSYTPGETDAGSNWPASLELKPQSSAAPAYPEWLTTPEQQPAPPSAPEAPAPSDGSIPDFMRAAGWGTATGAVLDSVPPAADSQSVESEQAQAVPAEIPDWLKAMAPADIGPGTPAEELPSATETPQAPGMPESEDTMDWLKKLGAKQPPAQEPVSQPTAPEPDWPGAAEPEAGPSKESLPVEPAASIGDLGKTEAEQDESFSWLESLAARQGARSDELLTNPAERLEAAPEWVEQARDLTLGQEPPVEAGIPEAPSADATPDWLKETPSEESGEEPPTAAVPVEPESSIGDLGKTEQERDESFLWLESLAARQGARSDELLTKPDERLESAPEWVQQVQGAAAAPAGSAPEGAEEKMDDWLKGLQPVEQAPEEEEAAPAPDSTGAWLRDLDRQEPAAEPEKPLEPADMPDWLQALKAREAPTDEVPVVPLEQEPAVQPEKPLEPAEMPDWLQALKGEQEAPAGEPPVVPAEQQPLEQEFAAAPLAESVTPGDEVPDWLKAIEEEKHVVEPELIPTPQEQPPAASVEPEAAEAEVPDWLKEMEGSSKGAGALTGEEELPEWLRAEVQDESALQPTSPSEWKPAEQAAYSEPATKPLDFEGKAAPVVQPVITPQPESAAVFTTGHTGALSTPVDPTLRNAQTELNQGNIQNALQEYGKLIKKARLLEEVIFDLREALYRYPVDVAVWQALGDAYMRANRLQDALDAYTKAEELLR